MNISLIITVKNEQDSIADLLDSIITQTTKPHEIIIVDAGSTDATTSIIKTYQTKIKNLKLIKKPGLNRSRARNLAISKAKSDIIAVTDAGCTLKKNWLAKITKPLIENKADSVAGFYQPQTNNLFQQAIAPFLAVMPDKFNPKTYLPSSRSIAFTKSAWLKVNKYPENLNYCEDLVFAQRLKSQTRLKVVPQALVYWRLPQNLPQFFISIANYARGDIQAGYMPHLTKIATVFFRYLVMLLLPPLFFIYLLFPIIKHRHYVDQSHGLLLLPLIQLTADLAIFYGVFSSLVKQASSSQ